ncbi:MAG: hypothetical protein ACREBA_04255 [Nitrosotalea sp.]
MSQNPIMWTCPECKETYLKNMTSQDIIEKIAKNVKRCNTCKHIIWEWKSRPATSIKYQ